MSHASEPVPRIRNFTTLTDRTRSAMVGSLLPFGLGSSAYSSASPRRCGATPSQSVTLIGSMPSRPHRPYPLQTRATSACKEPR